jgi:choline dehydrogenase-like flavoprotein
LSILTRPHNGRAACHYCGQCGRGCATHSNFSSTSVFLPPALATGKLKIITGAMAREVLTDTNGLATGVSYVNTADGQEYTVRAKAVVLAASACESARLMLNSKSPRHPHGLSNSSGQVGKNLTDSTGLSVGGFIPKLLDMPAHNEDGTGGMHLFMPWWLDNKKLNFPRGYHIEIGGGRDMPGYGFGGGIQFAPGGMGGGYGAKLKAEYRRYYGASVGFAGRGEMVPNADCYCEIDPNTVDSTASRCCASAGSGASRRSCRRSTCRRPSARSFSRWAASRMGRCPIATTTTGSRQAAESFTRLAARAWAPIRRRRR